MTIHPKRTKLRATLPDFGRCFLCFMSAFSLAMIIKNSEIAIEYVQTGLRLCASNVIPSLFPFMVISELLVTVGFGEMFGKTLGKPLARLFGISQAGCSALLLGALCGFPIGAKTAVSLYDKGAISLRELEKLLAFCNIPSSGFLISAVGVSLFSSRRFGVFLYITVLSAAIFTGLILRRNRSENNKECFIQPPVRLSVSSFTSAVSSATAAMLSVCAYVIFFSSVIGCLSHALRGWNLPTHLNALLFGIFEISSGVSAAALSGTDPLSAAVCGFIIGWSGISVHFQILSLCGGRGISFIPYFLSKFCQGLFCAFISWGYTKYLAPHVLSSAQSTGILHFARRQFPYTLIVCLLFLFCIILWGRSKKYRK